MKRSFSAAAVVAALTLAASTLSIAQQAPSAQGESAMQPGQGPHAHPMQPGQGPGMRMQPGHGAGQHPGPHGPRAGHGHPGPDGFAMPGAGMLRGLNLSEAQRDRVFNILHAQAPKMREQAREARNARRDLQQLSMAGELDETRLQAAAQRASRAMTDMAVLRARTHNAVFRELTPEQQAQLKARIEHRSHPMQHGHPGHPAAAQQAS